MTQEDLLKYLQENSLGSYMNNTKWERFVSKVILNNIYEPKVNINLIFEKGTSNGYSLISWKEVKRDGYEFIEWVKINPIKEEYVGKLVKPKLTDYSQLIESKLIDNQIPYQYENFIFTVYGYK